MKKASFKTFLEDFHNSDSLTAEEAAELINTQGQHYKRLIGNIHENILYRGMRVYYAPDAVLKYLRSNRQPLTTSPAVHQAADEYFEETFGIKFRSNSIFATADAETAAYYGDVYAIFPLGESKLCWSEDVNDMTNHLQTFLGGSEVNGKMVHNSIAMSGERLAAHVHQLLSHCHYTVNNQNLSKEYFSRLYKKHEVMIHCDEYVAVRHEFLPKVLKLVDK